MQTPSSAPAPEAPEAYLDRKSGEVAAVDVHATNDLPTQDDLDAQVAELERLLPQLDDFHRQAAQITIRWLQRARPKQVVSQPETVVLILSGRGFGKSLALSAFGVNFALWNDGVRVLVLAPTLGDIRDTVFEGESGILSLLEGKNERLFGQDEFTFDLIDTYNRSTFELVLKNGSRFQGLSMESPERIRGKQGHIALVDELATACEQGGGDESWANLKFCLRLGTDPKIVVATTPKPVELLYELTKDKDCAVITGSSYENTSLPEAFFKDIARYEGTARGDQEIHAKLLDLSNGGILRRKWWKIWTGAKPPAIEAVLISVDPAFKVTKRSDFTAMTVWGLFRMDRTIQVPDPFRSPANPHATVERHQSYYRLILLSAWKKKLAYPEMRDEIRKVYDRWLERCEEFGIVDKPMVLIEDKAAGHGLVVELGRALGSQVYPYDPGNDANGKLMRAHLVSDLLKDGCIWAFGKKDPDSKERSSTEFAPYAEEVISELARFNGDPNAKDDLVDSSGQAWQFFRERGLLGKDSDKAYDEYDPDHEYEEDLTGPKEPIYA